MVLLWMINQSTCGLFLKMYSACSIVERREEGRRLVNFKILQHSTNSCALNGFKMFDLDRKKESYMD